MGIQGGHKATLLIIFQVSSISASIGFIDKSFKHPAQQIKVLLPNDELSHNTDKLIIILLNYSLLTRNRFIYFRRDHVITKSQFMYFQTVFCILNLIIVSGTQFYISIISCHSFHEFFETNLSQISPQVIDYFVQICLALKHIHDRKILHRDLKSQVSYF